MASSDEDLSDSSGWPVFGDPRFKKGRTVAMGTYRSWRSSSSGFMMSHDDPVDLETAFTYLGSSDALLLQVSTSGWWGDSGFNYGPGGAGGGAGGGVRAHFSAPSGILSSWGLWVACCSIHDL